MTDLEILEVALNTDRAHRALLRGNMDRFLQEVLRGDTPQPALTPLSGEEFMEKVFPAFRALERLGWVKGTIPPVANFAEFLALPEEVRRNRWLDPLTGERVGLREAFQRQYDRLTAPKN